VNGHDGTGRLAQVADFTVAGKTGTAQMVNPATGTYYQSRLVASFVGFLPADDPRLVILVVLYDVPHGHFGGLVAAPVFSEIASGALQRLDVAPAHPAYDMASMLPFNLGQDMLSGGEDATDDSQVTAKMPANADAPVSAAVAGLTPDFRGLSLRRAFALARSHGLDLEVTGSGFVASQAPAPGAPLDRGAVHIKLSAAGAPAATVTAADATARHTHGARANRRARSLR